MFATGFKNVEQHFGRKDIATFDQIIAQMLEGTIKIDEVVDKQDIQSLMKNKFYAGFSLSDEVKSLIKESLEDEY